MQTRMFICKLKMWQRSEKFLIEFLLIGWKFCWFKKFWKYFWFTESFSYKFSLSPAAFYQFSQFCWKLFLLFVWVKSLFRCFCLLDNRIKKSFKKIRCNRIESSSPLRANARQKFSLPSASHTMVWKLRRRKIKFQPWIMCDEGCF